MAGCSQQPSGVVETPKQNSTASLEIVDKPVQTKVVLEGKEWQIVEMKKDGETLDLTDKKYTFSVKDGQAGVKICNSGGTAVRLVANQLISDDPVVSTMMFCEGTMDVEQFFFNGLDNDFTVEMSGENLILTDKIAGVKFALVPWRDEVAVSDGQLEEVLSSKSWKFTDMSQTTVSTNWSEKGYTFAIKGKSIDAKICNSISAAFTISGNKLSADGPVASTKMFCEGKMEDESAFQASISNGLTLTIEGDQLIMKDEVSGTEYRLSPQAE